MNTDSNSKQFSYFEETIHRRDEWRERTKKAPKVIKGKEIPVDNNQMGEYRWYLHPAMSNIPVRSALFWVHEIPPGGCSGKQKNQGGRIHYVMEGRGYVEVDGVKHEWRKGDLVLIPIKPDGTVHQLFNADPVNPVRLAVFEPNWHDALGPDLGSGLEQLENSSSYRE